jgi:hypothetical protein
MKHNLDLTTPACILLVGKPKRGKTNSIRFIIQKHSLDKFKGSAKFQMGIVFTRTKFNQDYSFLPDETVFNGYDEDILRKYLETLENHISEGNEAPANFVIFDDLIGLLSKNDPFLTNFLGTHRHTNTTIFLATQHLKTGASTTLREVCTHAIIFNSKTWNTITSLYENFGTLFPKLEQFKHTMQDITKEQYTAMLYLSDEDNIANNYLQFKCPDTSDWDYQIDF